MLRRDRLLRLEPLLAEVWLEAIRLPENVFWVSDSDEEQDETHLGRWAPPGERRHPRGSDRSNRWPIEFALRRDLSVLDERLDSDDPYARIRTSPLPDEDEVYEVSLAFELVVICLWLKDGLAYGTSTGEALYESARSWRFGLDLDGHSAINALRAMYLLLHFDDGDSVFEARRWTTVRTNV